MAQVIGEIANNGITIVLKPKLDEAERQKAEAEAILKEDKTNAAALEQKRLANDVIKTYGQGSQIQLAVRAVTGVLQGIATGEATQAAVGGLSPYANQAIKQLTTDPNTGEVNTQANLMAHALLGAVEAYATGNNATAGAAGAVGGELAAKIITEQLYQKTPEQLTEAQKQTVTTLSQLASGLAGGLISDSTADAINAAEIGKRAVEDNYLFNIPFTNPSLISDLNNKTIAEQLQKEAEEKAKQEIIDRGIPHYVLIEGILYKYSGKLAINTRNGDIFYGFGANPISIPASGLSASTQIGWIVNLESKELNNNLKNVINNTLQGSSIGGTVCYGICSSFSRTIQTDKPKNLFGIGVGGGLSIGGDRLYQLDEDK